MRGIFCCGVLAIVACATISTAAESQSVDSLLADIQAVGPLGEGHQTAISAWGKLAEMPGLTVPQVLAGMDGAGPLAQNWIRALAATVAEQAMDREGELPADELEAFVRNTEHAPRGRRLAFEYLTRQEPEKRDELLAGMLDDPSLELRRDAVQALVDHAEKLAEQDAQEEEVRKVYEKAFAAARDLDQIEQLAGKIKELGGEVDLPAHFGFVTDWMVIGPFDNTDREGFSKAYPPETEFNPDQEYAGKDGAVKWSPYESTDEHGLVNLNEHLVDEKQVVAYARAEWEIPDATEAEFRWGTVNATKVWLNGEPVAEHDVYHSGSNIDQYRSIVKLRPGKNVILVKVCQNEQTEPWTNRWEVQLRVCDELGTPVGQAP